MAGRSQRSTGRSRQSAVAPRPVSAGRSGLGGLGPPVGSRQIARAAGGCQRAGLSPVEQLGEAKIMSWPWGRRRSTGNTNSTGLAKEHC